VTRLLPAPWILGALLLWGTAAAPLQAAQLQPTDPLPIDARVTVGELDNGIRFYVRANERPEERAELRLVVNAGSILEGEGELGLAHFVEHLAFRGTTNFERQELVQYLEGIGMRFGPDLNAYTSFDETVYMLTVPTDDPEILATAFQILEDWASGVTFDPEEVDRERGVVVEEWRGRRGAGARVLDQHLPVMLHGSRYADRLPIGDPEVLGSASADALRAFYERWYRPDLMAVVAVGDFDAAEVEALIREHFGRIPAAEAPVERPVYPVPEHAETLVNVVADPEFPVTQIEIYHKQPARSVTTLADYRGSLAERLYDTMLNARLQEITQKADAPFLNAFSGQGSLVRSADNYTMAALVDEDGVERGLEALLMEAERVARHGFTATELDRARLNLLRSLERAHAERERSNSGAFVNAYVSHFLNGTPIPGIEFELAAARQLLPGIAVDEVNQLGRAWMTEANRVVLVSAPEKDDVLPPAPENLRGVLAAAAAVEVDPYEDMVTDDPLVGVLPTPGTIVERVHHEAVDVREWRLDNGVRVLLKETDFRDDEILLRGYAPGGHSLADDAFFFSASLASTLAQAGGLGAFSRPELQRVLAGKAASASALLTELEQQVSGSASPRDVETLFQLVYLSMTAPRYDEEPVQALVAQLRALLANRSADPSAAFQDTLQVTLGSDHPRAQPPTAARLAELDPAAAHAFFQERFADAAGFTFVLVGNLDLDALEPLVTTWLGGLPSSGTPGEWRDTGVRPPPGVVEKVVRQGIEPRSQTQIAFHGPFEYGLDNNHALASLAEVLRLRLREVLREDLGGTYGVSVAASAIPIRSRATSSTSRSAPTRSASRSWSPRRSRTWPC
jgi:zinc protease